MNRLLLNEINRYCDYFTDRIEEIRQLDNTLHSRLLIVALVDSLAKCWTQSDKGRNRFTRFVATFGDWSEHNRVSSPQLLLQVEQNPEVFSPTLIQAVEDRINSWAHFDIVRLKDDNCIGEYEMLCNSADEKRLVRSCMHLQLLYDYRCALVHEFREPGYGIDVKGKTDRRPFYIAMDNLDGTETWELTYPTGFLLSLADNCSVGLRRYLSSNEINPYSSYEFGSVWRHRVN